MDTHLVQFGSKGEMLTAVSDTELAKENTRDRTAGDPQSGGSVGMQISGELVRLVAMSGHRLDNLQLIMASVGTGFR